jgi:hypothetical protein
VVLAVARSGRARLPVPAATLLVAGGVAAAIAMTALFLRREPAGHLPPAAAVFLAAVLAGCLWVALAPPRRLGANRLASHIGAGTALVVAAVFVLPSHLEVSGNLAGSVALAEGPVGPWLSARSGRRAAVPWPPLVLSAAVASWDGAHEAATSRCDGSAAAQVCGDEIHGP